MTILHEGNCSRTDLNQVSKKKSKTETPNPRLDIPLTEIGDSESAELRREDDDPICKKSTASTDDSNLDFPMTESADPRRVKLRSNGEESTST